MTDPESTATIEIIRLANKAQELQGFQTIIKPVTAIKFSADKGIWEADNHLQLKATLEETLNWLRYQVGDNA